jgi:hypothetical protein
MFKNLKSKLALAAAPVLLAGGLFLSSPVGATTTAVDKLSTEAEKVAGIYDDIVPVAVGSIVFSIGAMLVKRIAFS